MVIRGTQKVAVRVLYKARLLKRDSAATKEFNHEEHNSNDKQQVHQASADVRDHAQQPKYEKK
jgi:hypothetical protein